jgi:hypothetical protein
MSRREKPEEKSQKIIEDFEELAMRNSSDPALAINISQ